MVVESKMIYRRTHLFIRHTHILSTFSKHQLPISRFGSRVGGHTCISGGLMLSGCRDPRHRSAFSAVDRRRWPHPSHLSRFPLLRASSPDVSASAGTQCNFGSDFGFWVWLCSCQCILSPPSGPVNGQSDSEIAALQLLSPSSVLGTTCIQSLEARCRSSVMFPAR